MVPPLTKQEKLVLFALAEDGTRTNAEIADRIQMRESTVGFHRRRLIRNGHLYFVNFPAFHKLGFEMMCELVAPTDPMVPTERAVDSYKVFCELVPQVFDFVVADGLLCGCFAFANVSEFVQMADQYEALFPDISYKGSVRYLLFPFSISRWRNGFSYAPSLQRMYNLDIVSEHPLSEPLEVSKVRRESLSRPEAAVLKIAVENPNITDAAIASRMRRSRQSVTDTRNALIKKGFFTRVAVPTLISSECGISAYVRLKFKDTATFDKKVSVAGLDWWNQSCWILERNSMVFALYLFSDHVEGRRLLSRYLGPFKEAELLTEYPDISLVPNESVLTVLDCRFAPVLKTVIT